MAIETPGLSVQAESRRLGVTRARIYQLLDVCAKIMEVRWPAGRWALQHLTNHLANRQSSVDCTSLLALRDLCYPDSLPSDPRPSHVEVEAVTSNRD